MPSDYTVIQAQRQHFGNERGTFGLEPDAPFVGPTKDYTFSCPNVNPGETAVLMFQSLSVDTQKNVFRINGQGVFGSIPASTSTNSWNGNIMLVERHFNLKPTGNVLHVESRNTGGGGGGNIDDFILDNIVIMYKTRS